MDATPAQVVAAVLTGRNVALLPWKIYVGGMPVTPDSVIVVRDTAGRLDGKYMNTGENVIHPGIQIKVRDKDYQTGYMKMMEVVRTLGLIRFENTLVGTESTILCAFTLVSGPADLGEEEQSKRRIFVMNGICSFPSVS